tara:strand:+ start:1608 stop:1862 length:255 start_codon:yes stop_codon:yes gene_type:complete
LCSPWSQWCASFFTEAVQDDETLGVELARQLVRSGRRVPPGAGGSGGGCELTEAARVLEVSHASPGSRLHREGGGPRKRQRSFY